MITVIGTNGEMREMLMTDAVAICRAIFTNMVNDGKKLRILQNPCSVVVAPFFLINQKLPGPATLFIGSKEAIDTFTSCIGRLMLKPEFAVISDYI